MKKSVGKYKASGSGAIQVEELIEQFVQEKGPDGPDFFSYDF